MLAKIKAGVLPVMAALFAAALSAGGAGRLLTLDFTDLRYQTLSLGTFSAADVLAGGTAVFCLLLGQLFFLPGVRSGRNGALELLKINFPLLLCLPFYFFEPDFLTLNLIIFSFAWSCGRAAGKVANCGSEKELPVLKIVSAVAMIFALGGGMVQWWSFAKMAMQWLDWGHFYEALVNTLDGRFFHLNLAGGCYLGSRFSISLLSLLPVVCFRSPVLFFFAGAFLVASGAVLTALLARVLKLPQREQLLLGLWFCFLPLTLNMLLVLVDGPHEIFLAIPSALGAWCCYRAKHYKWAAFLAVFCMGVRETLGFMLAGYAVILLVKKHWKAGVPLFIFAVLVSILLIGFVMPGIVDKSSYDHVVFFPHLGKSVSEIALSPFCKPEIFWGTLFSRHNFAFWVTLALPFIFGFSKVLFWIPMLADLLMVSLDARFDSQNILRHYQTVPLIVMSIAAVESIAFLKKVPQSAAAGFWSRFFGCRRENCAFASTVSLLAAALLMSWCFTQIPGLPASDKRLFEWSYADEVMDDFFSRMDKGAPVSASPRIASMLVGKFDVHIVTGDMDRAVQRYCLIESFSPVYNEALLRRKLLEKNSGYILRHSRYLDERLIQLFERQRDGEKTVEPTAANVFPASVQAWQKFGSSMPSALQELELRSRAGKRPGTVLVGARLREKVTFDIGFRMEIKYRGEKKSTRIFSSFGNGIVPAFRAKQGDVYIFEIAFEKVPEKCKITLVKLP